MAIRNGKNMDLKVHTYTQHLNPIQLKKVLVLWCCACMHVSVLFKGCKMEPLLVFPKCIIYWSPNISVSLKRHSLCPWIQRWCEFLFWPIKMPGNDSHDDITSWHQPVNQAGLKNALKGWDIGQALLFPSEWGKARDLRTHRVWRKPDEHQGEGEDRGALEENSAFEISRKFMFPLCEIQPSLLNLQFLPCFKLPFKTLCLWLGF